jgi:prolyl-tRNA synthetase
MEMTNGLVIPPKIAPIQVVVVPIAQHKEEYLKRQMNLKKELQKLLE